MTLLPDDCGDQTGLRSTGFGSPGFTDLTRRDAARVTGFTGSRREAAYAQARAQAARARR